jgi:hypothetical protein
LLLVPSEIGVCTLGGWKLGGKEKVSSAFSEIRSAPDFTGQVSVMRNIGDRKRR